MIKIKAVLLLISALVLGAHSEVSVVVDISNWQTTVDFQLVRKDGIEAVIHKATEGLTFTDQKYSQRRPQAEKAGLLWGAYHFGVGGVDGAKQADHFLKVVGDHKKVLLVLDHEPSSSKTMTTAEAEQFVKRVKQVTGRYPVLYGSSYFLSSQNTPTLNKCPLWVAHYTAKSAPMIPKGRSSWVFWQYTDGKVGGSPRTVKGIGACDRDRYSGTVQQLRKKWPNV